MNLSNHFIHLLLVCILAACAPTGNPYDDSLGFDPRMADKRLDQKRGVLAQTENQTQAERIKAINNKQQINAVQADNSAKRGEIDIIESQIAARAEDRRVLDRQIEAARRDGEETTAIVKKRDDLENEISGLSRRLAILIDTY